MEVSIPLKTETQTYIAPTEQCAIDTIEKYKEAQAKEGYILTNYKTTYKCKKDRKTGEIIDEHWLVSVTKEYEL